MLSNVLSGTVRTLVAAALLTLTGLLAVTPVHVTVTVDGGASLPTMTLNDRSPAFPAVAQPALSRMSIEVLRAPVRFMPPTRRFGPPLSFDDFERSGHWHLRNPWPVEIESEAVGSLAVLEGWYGERSLTFFTGPGEGLVRLSSEQGEETIDLATPIAGVRVVAVKPLRREVIASTPFLFRPLNITIEPAQGVVTLSARVAAFTIPLTVSATETAVVAQASSGTILGALVEGGKGALRSLLMAACLAAFGFACGLTLLAGSRLPISGYERGYLGIYAGAMAGSVLMGSFAFVLPTWQAALVAAVVFIAAGMIIRRRGRSPVAGTAPGFRVGRAAEDVRTDPWPAALMLASALVSLWPLVLSGGWFVGLLQTDIYDYGAVAERFAGQSVLSAGLPFGFGLRYLDMIPAAALQSAFGEPGMKILPALGVFWLAGLGPGTTLIARRLGAGALAASLAGLAAALSGSIYGLYIEGYLTRFVFTASLVPLTLAGVVALQSAGESGFGDRLRPWLPFIGAAAFAVSLVPYYSFFLPAVVLALLIRPGTTRLHALILGAMICLAVVLAANVNLLFVLYPEVALAYSAGADALARHTIFPFFETAQFPVMVLGLTPKHWDANLANALAGEMARWGQSVLTYQSLFTKLNKGAFLEGLSWATLVLSLAGFAQARFRLAPGPVFLLAQLVLSACAVALLARSGQHLYAMLNLAWTLGALVTLLGAAVFAALVSRLFAAAGLWRPVAVLAGLAGLIWIGCNGLTRLADGAGWYAHSGGGGAGGHVRVVPDLVAAEQAAQALSKASPAGPIVLSGRYEALRKTDTDRVLFNAVAAIFRARDRACANCQFGGGTSALTGLEPGPACPTAGAPLTMVIGAPAAACEGTRVEHMSPLLSLIRPRP